MTALVDGDSAALQSVKFASLLHLNLLPDRSHVPFDILSGHDRLREYLVDHILDEFAPLHHGVPVDVHLLEKLDQTVYHLEFFVL